MFNLAFCESFMIQGRSFPSEEVAIVRALITEGLIPGAIAESIRRGRTGVKNVLIKLKTSTKRSKVGFPSKITDYNSREIVLRARYGRYRVCQLRDTFNAPLYFRRF